MTSASFSLGPPPGRGTILGETPGQFPTRGVTMNPQQEGGEEIEENGPEQGLRGAPRVFIYLVTGTDSDIGKRNKISL